MLIKEIYLKNFGCFHDRQLFFHEGLNIIHGGNGSGKSTLHTFIQGMFFGIEKQRGRQSKKDTYSLYEPWEEYVNYSGKMKFQIEGKNFLIERNFYKHDKRSVFINEDDGEILSLEEGDLQAILEGLSESTYRNTISIGQLKGETDQSLLGELKNYIVNYNGDSYINITGALQKLGEEQKKWETELKRHLQMKENNAFKINSMLNLLEKEKENLDKQCELTENKQAELRIPENIIRQQDENKVRKNKFLPGFIFLLFAGIGMFYCMISQNILSEAFAIAILFCIFGVLTAVVKLRYENRGKNSNDTKEQELLWKIEKLKEDKKEKEIWIANLKEELEECFRKDEKEREVETEIAAIKEAALRITEAAKQMEETAGAAFQERASYYLRRITKGEYEKLFVNENLQMSVKYHNKILPLEQVSRGTMDLIYFCFRLAVGEAMYPNVKLPIFLDDAFAMLDEERLSLLLQLLYEKKRQVLIFTCHEREHQILTALGLPYHYCKL